MGNEKTHLGEIEGQLMFPGGALEEMKRTRERQKEYEREKQKLLESCASCDEYERGLAELLKKIKAREEKLK